MHRPSHSLVAFASRRDFLRSTSLAAEGIFLAGGIFAHAGPQPKLPVPVDEDQDSRRMQDLAAWTEMTMETPNPVPFGAEIFRTKTGERVARAANAVAKENDPSSHAEVRTIRLACARIKSPALAGCTLYTTCEPCPMCMACALWAGLDRVVYGATISDASKFVNQIMISAAEVARRSDMTCVVDGPIERDACLALFTNPIMQKAFQQWKSRKH